MHLLLQLHASQYLQWLYENVCNWPNPDQAFIWCTKMDHAGCKYAKAWYPHYARLNNYIIYIIKYPVKMYSTMGNSLLGFPNYQTWSSPFYFWLQVFPKYVCLLLIPTSLNCPWLNPPQPWVLESVGLKGGKVRMVRNVVCWVCLNRWLSLACDFHGQPLGSRDRLMEDHIWDCVWI